MKIQPAFFIPSEILHCRSSKAYNIAFTLAEVLITLGIIGVVAALTIPNVIAKYQEMVAVVRLKKSYSVVTNAINRAMAEEGYSNYAELFTGTNAEVADKIFKYMNIIERCNKLDAHGCGTRYTIKNAYKVNDGTGGVANDNAHGERALLIDGSLIRITKNDDAVISGNSCSTTYQAHKKNPDGSYIPDGNGGYEMETYTVNICGAIMIDVDGPKGKNQFGYDNYAIRVTGTKLTNDSSAYGNIFETMRTGQLSYVKYNLDDKYED